MFDNKLIDNQVLRVHITCVLGQQLETTGLILIKFDWLRIYCSQSNDRNINPVVS